MRCPPRCPRATGPGFRVLRSLAGRPHRFTACHLPPGRVTIEATLSNQGQSTNFSRVSTKKNAAQREKETYPRLNPACAGAQVEGKGVPTDRGTRSDPGQSDR